MPIVQQGNVNTTALVVPDLYVQIVPPQNLVLNGVPTNVLGIVGTASWGPVGQPVIVSNMADYARQFGSISPRKYDLGTQVATAVQQGAQNFRCVRVTDGTEMSAQTLIQAEGSGFDYALALTAAHPGTLGNLLQAFLSPGTRSTSWKLTVTLPGAQPEVFDNITGSGSQFWINMANAVNHGQSAQRGPSQFVTAQAGFAAQVTTAPVPGGYPFQNGTDGLSGVGSGNLVGEDAVPRTGMYALRGQGCGLALLADADDSSHWTEQAQFGLSEGVYMILTSPSGDTITNAVNAKQSAGLDTYAAKLMFGDWLWWFDQANATTRLVSPQGFVAGRLANLSPEQSSLNKPLYGVIGSQKSGTPGSGQSASYSAAELSVLLGAGIDVISNPQPGGSFWGVRGGHNASSNAAQNGDNYTRLTNYIAATLAAGLGLYVGQLINADLFRRIRATQLSFLQNMLGQGLLGSIDGSLPFSVVCDTSNNSPSRTALGYVQSDAQVQYQAINEKFIVNLEGGQTVQVSRQTLPSGQAA